jgi:hypothetical protein
VSDGRAKRGELAVLIVRNDFRHDARVLRAARTVRALGFDTTVLAVVSPTEQRVAEDIDGIQVRRLGSSSRLARSIYRRLAAATSRRRRVEGPGDNGADDPLRAAPQPGSKRAPLREAVRRLLRLATTLAYYRRAIAAVLAIRPTLVHCNDYDTMWVGVVSRLLLGSAVIYDSHELWPDRNLRPEPRWWLLLCEAVFVRAAHAVVMTNPGHADVLARRYRVPLPQVVRNIRFGNPS